MEFATKYNRPDLKEESGGGERIVETQGYMPAEIQIADMIMAGQRLGESRKERFDFDSLDDIPDDFIDPTRSPGFDMADASMIDRSLKRKLAEEKTSQAEKRKETKKKEIEDKEKGKIDDKKEED